MTAKRPWIAALEKMKACEPAIIWADDSEHATLQDAWNACEHADWMCWLLINKYTHTAGQVRLALCACARTSLKYVHTGEDRPRLAIECAERYARGRATDVELAAARDAAWDAAGAAAWDAARASARASARDAARAAARAAAWDAAWDAAGAAAWAAARDAAWDVAGAAAWAAARDAAGDAAGDAALKEMAVIVRGMIPDPENLPRLEDM